MLDDLKIKTHPILKKYGVDSAGVFGSRARGDARIDSDYDILVNFSDPIGLFKLISLKHELEDSLGASVDLVTEGALSPYLRQSIFRDLTSIYDR